MWRKSSKNAKIYCKELGFKITKKWIGGNPFDWYATDENIGLTYYHFTRSLKFEILSKCNYTDVDKWVTVAEWNFDGQVFIEDNTSEVPNVHLYAPLNSFDSFSKDIA